MRASDAAWRTNDIYLACTLVCIFTMVAFTVVSQ